MKNESGWQLLKNGPEAYENGAWARDIVDWANLQRGDRVLDIGCDTGIVARYAHRSMKDSVSITGVDVNEIVLKKARDRFVHPSLF